MCAAPGGILHQRIQEEARAAFTGQTGNHQALSARYALLQPLPRRDGKIKHKLCWCEDADCASEGVCTLCTGDSFLLESVCQIAAQLLLFLSLRRSLMDLLNRWRWKMTPIMTVSVFRPLAVSMWLLLRHECESSPKGTDDPTLFFCTDHSH